LGNGRPDDEGPDSGYRVDATQAGHVPSRSWTKGKRDPEQVGLGEVVAGSISAQAAPT